MASEESIINRIEDKLWHELGRGIGNEDLNDLAGYSVAISKSGTTVAVGSPLHTNLTDPNPVRRAGRVRVYRYNSTRDGWQKIGQDIEGDAVGDQFGYSLDLSYNGKILAIGAPYCMREGKIENGCVKIYDLELMQSPDETEREVWLEVGNMIVGEGDFDHFGTSLQMAKYDEYRQKYMIAIGAPGAKEGNAKRGKVYIYSFSWQSDLDGVEYLDWRLEHEFLDELSSQTYSEFGSSLSMTDDSNMIAIGAPKDGDNSQGAVRVYSQETTTGWVQQTIVPSGPEHHNAGDGCGTSVSFDSSGKFLAYGCSTANEDPKFKVGKVKIITRTIEPDLSMTYVESQELFGEHGGDHFGSAVSMSNLKDGTVFLAIGAPNNSKSMDLEYQNAGHMRVYYHSSLIPGSGSESWYQAGLDVDGLNSGDLLGSYVAINAEGHTAIVGAPDGGYAKIYQLAFTAPPSPAPTPFDIAGAGRETSVAMVSLITIIFALGLLAAAFIFMQKIRKRRSFDGVSTSEGGHEMISQSPPGMPVTKPTEAADFI